MIIPASPDLLTDYPFIGWRNLVASNNISATSEEAGYPASNLANPATFSEWRATSTAEQYLTVTALSDSFDYIGIAKHNLSSAGCPVSVEVWNGSSWDEIVVPQVPPDDEALVFLFGLQSASQARLRMQTGGEAARAATLYLGQSLTAQRRLYGDHSPLFYGRETQGPAPYSEGGAYLGRIITRTERMGTAKFKLLRPDWYRDNFEPFLESARALPFFLAWRPQSYPGEVTFTWLTNNPKPVNAPPSHLIDVELKLSALG